MNRAVKILKILATMPNHRTRKCGPGFLRYFNGTWNEQFVVLNHSRCSTRNPPSASLRRGRRLTFNVQKGCGQLDRHGIEMYASRVNAKFILCVLLAGTIVVRAQSPDYFVYVSNERSGDISVIDGATDAVVATFKAGKRPRGIHAAPDGKRVFVTVSGSPRMAPGLDENRAPADKTADGLGVIDPVEHRLIDRWHVGSDPEQFAISKDGRFAFIANEDDASALIVDLGSGQSRGNVKVSEEPEGVGVNPQNGEVYVTCEEKGEVFAIDPDQQRVVAKIETGGRPRSIAFLPDGSRAYVACENGGYIAVLDTASHKLLSKIQLPTGSLPMGTVISKDGKELYLSTGRGNSVAVIDTAKNAPVTTISVGNRAWGIALDPSGSKLYTANGASNDVSVVDIKSRKELRRIKVGDGPWGITTISKE
jgi:YVTN family beta-propeller protein